MRGSTALVAILAVVSTLSKCSVGQSNSPTALNSSIRITTRGPPQGCTPHAVGPVRQEEIFNAFVQSLYVARTVDEAYTHFTENFTNHSPDIVDGLVSSYNILEPLFTNSSVKVQVLHQAFVAPFGWVHLRIDGFLPQPTAAVDIYR
ncbi:hypothetical protein B0H19DRAFT_1245463 [Mycena capillaripes]|nr:hypothetical protein B0H19DRAFT_1245463 [Mycena capillaripes]